MEREIYNIDTSIRFDPLERIDVGAIDAGCKERWFNTSLTRVNDSVVRLGIIEGEFHWHSHREEDEFFYVLSGRLLVDLEERSVELGPNQGFTVPRGVVHRTRAPERTVMLMVEGAGVVPTGDE
ncbi:MAG TPA: cupin domain-containing protein [Candidatus Krumholzibacteria bacterium]|jgi:mannose-6-phosphate isomerase-like protein (cupin superfamily)